MKSWKKITIVYLNKNKEETDMSKVVTECYGEETTWESREEAERFFLEGMVACEGSEQERYSNIYCKLLMGLDYCTDDSI